jgi:hypothetical protein
MTNAMTAQPKGLNAAKGHTYYLRASGKGILAMRGGETNPTTRSTSRYLSRSEAWEIVKGYMADPQYSVIEVSNWGSGVVYKAYRINGSWVKA